MPGIALSTTKKNVLAQSIIVDKQVITYRIAARMFKCTVQEARQYLEAFHRQSEGRTHATHLVTGHIRRPEVNGAVNGDADMADADAENGMTDPETSSPRTAPATYMLSQSKPVPEAAPSKYVHCVMLVPEDEMKAKLGNFSRIMSNEVYSLEPNKLPDLVLLTKANMPIYSDAALAAVESSILGRIVSSRTTVQPKKAAPLLASTSSTTTAAPTKAPAKRKAPEPEEANQTSGSKSNKPPVLTKSATSNSTTANKAKPSNSKMPVDAKQPDGDEFDGMLDDDDDLMAELAAEASTSVQKQTSKSEDTEKDGQRSTTKRGQPRKTRRVVKKITTKNEKGFRITKEVETDESYSGSSGEEEGIDPVVAGSGVIAKLGSTSSLPESSKASKSTKIAASAPSKPKKTAKPGEQTSLGNFFSKPKPKK